MHIFLNGLAATAGGGLTYQRNVVPRLAASRDVRTTLLVSPSMRAEFEDLPNIEFARWSPVSGAAARFWQEQKRIPRLLREYKADLLLSTGNFALRRSPVPQILLSRNSLYTSAEFRRGLLRRREYGSWARIKAEGCFARQSIRWADCTVVPSQSFAQEVRGWAGRDVIGLHHGFDLQSFSRDSTPLPPEIRQKLACPQGTLRLLFVSHYNYYRNFETLFRAVARVKQIVSGRPLRLFLTCDLASGDSPGAYRSTEAENLISRLSIQNEVVQLGAIPYASLHHVYRAADVYATAAYAESFAHPLVEAMASGLPIVASELPVHREICQDAAVYSPAFSPQGFAERLLQVGDDFALRMRMSSTGVVRAECFSWDRHVVELLAVARSMTGGIRAEHRAAVPVGSPSAA